MPAILFFAILFFADAAIAQDTKVNAGTAWTGIQPVVETALGAIVTGLIGWASAAFTRWTGIQIEARHREALHSAAMTGITLGMSRIGKAAEKVNVDVRSTIVKEAADWVFKSVPDAVKYFGLKPETLVELIRSKLEAFQHSPEGALIASKAGK